MGRAAAAKAALRDQSSPPRPRDGELFQRRDGRLNAVALRVKPGGEGPGGGGGGEWNTGEHLLFWLSSAAE